MSSCKYLAKAMNTGLRLNGHAQTGSNRASESKHRCHDGCHPLACFWNLGLQIWKKSAKLNQMCTDKNCRVCKHLETGNLEVLLRKDQTGMYQCSFEKNKHVKSWLAQKKSFSKSYSKAQPGCVIYINLWSACTSNASRKYGERHRKTHSTFCFTECSMDLHEQVSVMSCQFSNVFRPDPLWACSIIFHPAPSHSCSAALQLQFPILECTQSLCS